ncbi:unnamed protein product [Caenorhabditis nigoni]|uniref:EB domain-containing protein n=1 Tax=Caenorhabditis nigoni TaxID=1611254 RepID=A0A2G5SK28_9PELO|nr:hypothetical protein B9Z55_022279 [Caenorhabditis nigoni]
MNFKWVLAVLVLISLPLGTPAMSLKRHYRRPLCEPSQSCSYSYQQFTFELCDCPQAESCPMDNGVQLKGITYQFCGSRELPVCAPQEIAAEINNLQTSIYCVCPFEQIYVKQKESPINKVNVKYVCQEKEMCEAGQMCGAGNHIVGIKSFCQCVDNLKCQISMPNVFNPLVIQNATCQSV